ncbi:MAG TPA: cofactor assembly of complex C subunit B [Oscillatoriaceae cyanobacterium M33_DOE_052]|uniref:Cofactor assembly of complex C subunit B n=1 Tax=Planktothricoides sp. SpSt-374 TaxID=2282167 RepID=A0A7C3ZVY2_9CYAN|nr:cofactor assembly of complex C subunit B [Oscillatoriaceae cyanobacterium M33_DOE_052]
MNLPVLSSTFFLTLLMGVGLVFFIRASVKDRTEQLELFPETDITSTLEQLQQHFHQRAYRLAAVQTEAQQLTFEGFVRPSWFLAIFLSLLAAAGTLCLALVLSLMFPVWGKLGFALLLLSPLAGWFYWQKAGRLEQVRLQVEPLEPAAATSSQMRVKLTGHRDELALVRLLFQQQPAD